jgi:hypothetical protein
MICLYKKVSGFIFILSLISLTYFNVAYSANGPLSPYTANPFYWQDGSGDPIVLIGGSDHDSIFQWNYNALVTHLDLLKASGGNYIRNTMNSRSWDPINDFQVDGYPQPFAKTGNIFDLDQWNTVYWNKLRTFLDETQQRGIIVQLEFWDMAPIVQPSAWPTTPWNPKNNVNYTVQNTRLKISPRGNSNEFLNTIPSLNNDSLVLFYQQKYVEKVLSIASQYDHILYQIDNETFMSSNVSTYWANYIRSLAAKPIYIAESRRYRPPTYKLTNFQLASETEISNAINNPQTFNYLDISQNGGNSGQKHYDNLVWYRNQVKNSAIRPINHVKTYRFNWPTGTEFKNRTEATQAEGIAKFWRTIFGGAASVRFHRFNTKTPKPGIGLTVLGQAQIKSARMFLDAINIFAMAPNNNVLSSRSKNEAYALANVGQQYAVYFTGQGDRIANINLSSAPGTFTQRWLNVSNKTWQASTTVNGGSSLTLQTPQQFGQWVVVLTRSGNVPPPPEAGNILTNGDFGQGQTDWTNFAASDNRTLLTNSSQCRGGSGACVRLDGLKYRHIDHLKFSVNPSQTYNVSGYIKVPSPTSGSYKIVVRWFNGNAQVGGFHTVGAQSSSTFNNLGYVRRTRNLTSPASANLMEVQVIRTSSDASSVGYFDDITVQ